MTDTLPALFDADVLEAVIPEESLRGVLAGLLRRADDERWVERLHDHDASLWSSDPAVAARIGERLGWLASPVTFADRTPALEAFGEGIREAGFGAAIVAGMGGSSLAPAVLAEAFADIEGWLTVRILDSTDPAAVEAAWDGLDPLATLVVIASKSGTTIETLAFLADAWKRIEVALRAAGERRESPGEFMVAISDPGHAIEAIPHQAELREVFLNPEDIGGRYAALTYVGLVPASLLGIDIDALIASAVAMYARTHASDPAANPGAALGLVLGALARAGRDKLTFVADLPIARLEAWLEQLLAESTGKQGVGIVPIAGEPLGDPRAYGSDRAFVRLVMEGARAPLAADGRDADAVLADLAAAGHPVLTIRLADPIDLAGEFVRWEVATALAGAVLQINPFDEPDVAGAKDNTRRVLAEGDHGAHRPAAEPLATGAGLAFHGDAALRLTAGDATVAGELGRHLARIRPFSYLALQAFVAPSAAAAAALDRIRVLLRDATRAATTVGFGPRFLHSTGQLHKGGPAIGWFLQLSADHPADLPVPGRPYSFGRLIDAQALGDFEALEAADLPVARVHLGSDVAAGLEALESALRAALANRPA